MDLRICTLTCLVLFCLLHPTEERTVRRSKRSLHVPPLGIPSFLRDSVEQTPKWQSPADRSAAYRDYGEFGSRSLPLRSAVESVPDVKLSTKRLPLRDAVEKRPPPDEAFDLEYDTPETYDLQKNTIPLPIYRGGGFLPQTPFSIPNKYSVLQSYIGPQGYSQQTYYSPLQYFRGMTGNLGAAPPYRADNGNQQLLMPYFQRAKSLYSDNPFLKNFRPHKEFLEKAQVDFDSANQKRIVCYVEGNAVYRREPLTFSPADLDPFACTHVIYAFASIDPHSYQVIARDEEYDIIQGAYRSVTGLKRKNPMLKVLISLGGGREEGSHRFSSLISNAVRRRDFIRSVMSFIRKYNFDGLDLHWQYPGAEELGGHTTDKEYFALLLEELSEVFKPQQWLLSVSAPASRFRIEDGFNPTRLANTVDFVNMQAYDFHRDREPVADHHAPLNFRPHDKDLDIFYNVDYAVKYWLKKGLPRSKLVVGLPFFGRTFTLQDSNDTEVGARIKGPGREGYYTQNPGFLAYFEICDMITNEGLIRRTDAVGSPYVVNGDQWIGFDDPESIERKIAYVKQMDLGGIFVWSADLDDFKGLCGDKWPLMTTLKRYLKGNEAPSPHTQLPTKPLGTCESDGLYSDPRNCANYYICRSSLSYHLSCGSHMMFDPTTGRCDYIEPKLCRPGQTVHIPNALKDIDNILRNEKLVSNDKSPKVVCYATNWAFYRKGDGKFVPEHLDQRLCTHVVYAFASLDPEKLLVKEFDPWADLDNNLYERVTSLRDPKVLLALGGWTDSAGDKYSRLVSDGSARRKFVVGAVSFLRRHGFQGLHIDWNYPICWQSNCRKGPASDKPNFTKLLQELRKEFDKESPPLTLAVAISGYKEVIDAAYELSALGQAADFLSVMSYDYHGNWERRTGHVSPLYHRNGDTYPQYNTNFTMEYLVANGAPREKLLVGVPFYGQTFTLANHDGKYDQGVPTAGPGEPGEYTKQPGMLAYYEVCSRIRNERWIVNRDDQKATGPYAYFGDQWVGYEDVKSVKDKAVYIKTHGFGGAVAWTIDLDDFLNKCCERSFPLLRSLNSGLGLLVDHGPQHGDCTKPPAPVTPPPPTMTTGFDTGAEGTSSTTPHWGHPSSKPSKPSTASTPWWSSSESTSASSWWEPSKPSVTSTRKPPSTTPWWVPSTPEPTTTSHKPSSTSTARPSTTTPPWWQPEVTTIPPPAVIMPEIEHGPPMKCEPGQYIPDPQNCNAYYRCILGEMTKQYCAGGLHWNRDSKVCDWPSSANCKEQKPPSSHYTTTNSKYTTQNMWSSLEQSKSTPNYITRTTTERETWSTTKAPSIDPLENCNSGEYYPHEHCSSFYVCVNGQLVTQSCAPGLHWNADTGICDWSYKVRCTNRRRLAQQTQKLVKETGDMAHRPNSACQAGSFSAYAGDCTQYLLCLWNKYETFQCSEGLHWNSDKKICDWPENAHCTEGGGLAPGNDEEGETEPTTPKPSYSTTEHHWSSSSARPTPSTTEYPSESHEPLSGYYKIVCYFTNWAWYRRGIGKYVPEDIDPNLCTHIVYGFAVLDYENLVIKAHDSWADFDNRFYERVVAYKKKGIKVSLALGGWNDSLGDKYSRLVNNPSARARFIKHALEFLEKYDFDGLDLDWEYPKCWQVDCTKGPDSDKPAFAAFVAELKQAFRPKGYLLSSAVSPSKTVIDAGYDVPSLAQNFDWIAVMTYDFHGQWDKQTGHVAPMYLHPEDEVAYFNANFSLNYWISEGVPRRKIVMGMPLYGQSFQLENAANHGLNAKAPGPGQAGEFTRAAGFLAYYEICDRIKNDNWKVVHDEKHRMGPYAYKGNQWVSYDDKEMIRLKSEYIRKMDLGGGMIWALDLDDFKNRCGEGRHPLLNTIRKVLAAPGKGIIEPNYIEPEPERPPKHTLPPSIDSSSVTVSMPHSTSSPPIVDKDSQYKVVCYFTNWAWYRQGVGKYLPGDIDPDLCTHIVYGFAVLDGDQLVIKPHDTWADFDNKFYEKVTEYKAKGIKVLIAIGGWNDSAGDKYSRLANNPSARRRFIAHVVDFIEKNNFDGLDLDWEYPKCWQVDCNKGPESDKPAFADLVRELYDAFRPKGWLLSAAVSPSRRVMDAGYDVPALSRYLDWIAVMCYDYHGQWDKITGHVAPMYAHPEDEDVTFNTNFTIHYWIDQGADRKKLVLGMPMYGQSFSLANNDETGLNAPTYGGGEAGEETRARGFLAYYEICTNVINKGWTVVRDKKNRIGPYAYLRDQWVSFDDIAMIRYKSEYIKDMGLGGGMIWALDLDDFKNLCGCENYPLLKTINRVLRNYAKPAPQCQLGMDRPSKPTQKPKPSTQKPQEPWQTERPQEPWQTEKPEEPWQTQKPTHKPPPISLPCQGRLFVADDHNCNQYYLCNQGQLLLQACPSGLFWNQDHCDWPENTECHPDASTMAPTTTTEKHKPRPPYVPEVPVIETTSKPSRPGTTIQPSEGGYKVVCYFTNWAWYRQGMGKYLPDDIDPSLCTHIAYGFAVLDSNSLTIKPHDSWADIDNDFYKKVTSYKSYGIKVLIALGGWNDSLGNKYSRLVNDPQARARFIAHVSQFIEKWGFDGLDLDWEYPKCWQVDCNKGPHSDKQGFAALVAELSAAFKPKGWLLSSAVSPSKTVIDAGYDVESLSQHFDWIAIMTYDFHGHWDKQTGHVAPLYYYPGDTYDYFNANFSLHYWMELGAHPSKLVMGMPLYGQSFSLADTSSKGLNEKAYGPGEAGDYTRAGGFLAFYEICERVKRRSWKVTRDPEGRIGPYAVSGNQWVSYDDMAEVRRKSKLVKQLGLGGGMIWALDLDDFRNTCGCGKHPLLKTMNNELRGIPLDNDLENCT